jgi:hypothetical protein
MAAKKSIIIQLCLGILELHHENSLKKHCQPQRADAPRSGALQKSTGMTIFMWIKWGSSKMEGEKFEFCLKKSSGIMHMHPTQHLVDLKDI